MRCSRCRSTKTRKAGTQVLASGTKQKYHCNKCGYNFQGELVPHPQELLRRIEKIKAGV